MTVQNTHRQATEDKTEAYRNTETKGNSPQKMANTDTEKPTEAEKAPTQPFKPKAA